MSELKQYLDKVSWTESVSQHKEAIIFIHDRQIKNLERQLKEANDKNKWIKKQQESWNSTTKETIEDLERKLEEARERLTIAINCMPQLAKINYEQDCK